MAVKILEIIEGTRKARGMTRSELAEKMGGAWDKEKLDKLFENVNSCPRAETLAEIFQALGMPTYPPEWFRAKQRGDE